MTDEWEGLSRQQCLDNVGPGWHPIVEALWDLMAVWKGIIEIQVTCCETDPSGGLRFWYYRNEKNQSFQHYTDFANALSYRLPQYPE